ncbi:sigma factor [Streptomyces xiamenensis]|uniref:sigma factor n=1 Tax=Streptomyces xiamenensis TaxID=408015 RepID=UPI0035D949D9
MYTHSGDHRSIATHHQGLVAHIAGLLPTHRQQDAEDLAQDVWLEVLSGGEPVDAADGPGLPAALIAVIHDVLDTTPELPELVSFRDHHAPVVDSPVLDVPAAAPAITPLVPAPTSVVEVLVQHGVIDSPLPAAA